VIRQQPTDVAHASSRKDAGSGGGGVVAAKMSERLGIRDNASSSCSKKGEVSQRPKRSRALIFTDKEEVEEGEEEGEGEGEGCFAPEARQLAEAEAYCKTATTTTVGEEPLHHQRSSSGSVVCVRVYCTIGDAPNKTVNLHVFVQKI
jgi:hypothetical protein